MAYGGQPAFTWDVQRGVKDCLLQGHRSSVLAGVYSPEGKLVVTAGLDGAVRLYDASTCAFLRAFTGHNDAVFSVAFDPDGTRIVTASTDGSARIFEVASGITLQVLPAFQPHRTRDSNILLLKFALKLASDFVASAQFSADGQYVLTADRNSIGRWDAEIGRNVAVNGNRGAPFRWVAFSPDERTVATAEEDDTV